MPAAHTAIENFRSKHPDFKFPVQTHMVAGLDARVKDFLNSKKAATSAASLRPEKIKKNKVVRLISLKYISLRLIVFLVQTSSTF